MVTVLALYDRVSCFHSLTPFIFHPDRRLFTFTDSADYCLRRDRNRVLVLLRLFIKPDLVDHELLRRLRDRYQRLVYFHEDAGGGIPRLDVLPYVDLFYHKALFRDRSLYLRPLYGKELYSDYYHRRYGVDDPGPKTRPVPADRSQLSKLRLSWNIGVGDYPRGTPRQRIGVAVARVGLPGLVRLLFRSRELRRPRLDAERPIDVHARLGMPAQPTIAFQRYLILEAVKRDPRFLTGKRPQRVYNRELSSSKLVLSPFGWGEVCLRDFEAVRAGAVLLKPNMDHLETWPDIYAAGSTYVPFDWDAKAVSDSARPFIEDADLRRRTAEHAFAAYKSQLDLLPRRFDEVLSEIVGTS